MNLVSWTTLLGKGELTHSTRQKWNWLFSSPKKSWFGKEKKKKKKAKWCKAIENNLMHLFHVSQATIRWLFSLPKKSVSSHTQMRQMQPFCSPHYALSSTLTETSIGRRLLRVLSAVSTHPLGTSCRLLSHHAHLGILLVSVLRS